MTINHISVPTLTRSLTGSNVSNLINANDVLPCRCSLVGCDHGTCPYRTTGRYPAAYTCPRYTWMAVNKKIATLKLDWGPIDDGYGNQFYMATTINLIG